MTQDLRLQKWEALLSEQANSGLSKKVFCERSGIKVATFYYWQRRLEERSATQPGSFHQVQPPPEHEIVVCLANKELRLRSTSPHTLAQIIEHLADA